MQASEESTPSTNSRNLALSWLGSGVQVITIFVTLSVITGRIYIQSYWNTFGITPNFINISLTNYAIISPNTTIASVLIAVISTTPFIYSRYINRFLDSVNLNVLFVSGMISGLVGIFGVSFIMSIDASTWIPGTVGVVFGIAYFLVTAGGVAIGVASRKDKENSVEKQEKSSIDMKLSKLNDILFGWIKKVPSIYIKLFMVIFAIFILLITFFYTARSFGINEAMFTYKITPVAYIQIDSTTGFEDIALTSNLSGSTLIEGKIITENSGLLYFSPSELENLNIRVIPISRVQAIQYEVESTPIGK